MPIQLDINGKHYSVENEPDRTLLYVLREELGLTGAKYGCGEARCGSCTVLLNGIPCRACQFPIREADGKTLETIEGLEQNGVLHPLQQAFLSAGAFQCGYCTPGMIMSSLAMLRKNHNPTTADIAQFLQGHICRCGVHPRIVLAIQQAAKVMRGGTP